MSVAAELQAIYDTHGVLTPDVLLGEATDPRHPLHDRFTWDDSVAAQKHRRNEARQLIRSVRVQFVEPSQYSEGRSVRAWHSTAASDGSRTYEPADSIALDPFQRELLLKEMQRDVAALQRRWGAFREFADVLNGIVEQQRAS